MQAMPLCTKWMLGIHFIRRTNLVLCKTAVTLIAVVPLSKEFQPILHTSECRGLVFLSNDYVSWIMFTRTLKIYALIACFSMHALPWELFLRAFRKSVVDLTVFFRACNKCNKNCKIFENFSLHIEKKMIDLKL